MYDPEKSLKVAEKLLEAPNINEVISLKIEPEPLWCCCSHCWPLVWQEINELINPQGPIEHEGRALVGVDDEICVLEQHESGPEILLLVTASLNLISTVINLIVAVCGSLRKERKCPAKVKIVKRRFFRNQVEEEMLVEVKLNDSRITWDEIKGILEAAVEKSLVSKKK